MPPNPARTASASIGVRRAAARLAVAADATGVAALLATDAASARIAVSHNELAATDGLRSHGGTCQR